MSYKFSFEVLTNGIHTKYESKLYETRQECEDDMNNLKNVQNKSIIDCTRKKILPNYSTPILDLLVMGKELIEMLKEMQNNNDKEDNIYEE